MNRNSKKGILLVGTFIGLCFLWTSCGYLSWLYNLSKYTAGNSMDLLSEVIGYIFQALGLAFMILLNKKHPMSHSSHKMFLGIILLDYLFIVLSVVAGSLTTALIFGYLMNFAHGIVAAIYLYLLTEKVAKQYRGLTFGLGYGASSIISWLISLCGQQNFLKSYYALIAYAVLCLITLPIAILCYRNPAIAIERQNKSLSLKSLLGIVGTTIFFLTLVRGLGFYFPMADISRGISLEFSRVFYAIGLILSGIIIDRNRKNGAICCGLALIFPFLMLVFSGEIGTSIVFWIMGYIFFGFFNVYRIVVFTDISASQHEFFYLAPLGLAIGRIGDAAGSLCGIALGQNVVILGCLGGILFLIAFLFFLNMYTVLYVNSTKEVLDDATLLANFAAEYELSSREIEVLQCIYQGLSNRELAAKLFISENTVKFHVRNLLKKTNCENRVEIIEKVKRS